jgi:hypothetical protein
MLAATVTLFSPSPAFYFILQLRMFPSAHSELLKGTNHDTRGSGQETQQVRYQDIPFDHQRR